jgi:hypothetical protein
VHEVDADAADEIIAHRVLVVHLHLQHVVTLTPTLTPTTTLTPTNTPTRTLTPTPTPATPHLQPIIALDDVEAVPFVPIGVLAAALHSLAAPVLARALRPESGGVGG